MLFPCVVRAGAPASDAPAAPPPTLFGSKPKAAAADASDDDADGDDGGSGDDDEPRQEHKPLCTLPDTARVRSCSGAARSHPASVRNRDTLLLLIALPSAPFTGDGRGGGDELVFRAGHAVRI